MYRQLNALLSKIAFASKRHWVNFRQLLHTYWGSTTKKIQNFGLSCQQNYEKLTIASKYHINSAQKIFQHYYKRAITAIIALYQNIINMKNWVILHHTTAADDIKNIGEFMKAYALRKWAQYQPHIDEFTKWSMAVSATASTLKTSVQILPIILAMSGILAGGIPLVGFLFPEFFLTELALFTVVVGVSLFAGYLKYNELVARAELDAKTEEHERRLEALSKRLEDLEAAYRPTRNTSPDISDASRSKSSPPGTAMNDPDILTLDKKLTSKHKRRASL
tara:strand:+ start:40290 stop:41123 length:834 start_codon:yes stop_codon:yes gene_type:complete